MGSTADKQEALIGILRADPWLVSVLECVRDVGPPSWAVGAGVIRNIVWDRLEGRDKPSPVKDVDVAYLDYVDLSAEAERTTEQALYERRPDVPWDAKNQARVHFWYEDRFGHPIDPITSLEDAVGRWPETATSVAVHLGCDDELEVIAPLGLDDLLGMVLRHNPRQVSRDYFLKRLHTKRVQELWPRVRVIID